jgi:hypothetical protein
VANENEAFSRFSSLPFFEDVYKHTNTATTASSSEAIPRRLLFLVMTAG